MIKQSGQSGILYIVATPIGNIADISERAIETLRQVDLILAEDTRHSSQLLNRLNISNKLLSYYQHNEQQRCHKVIAYLLDGQSVALISDAGTPLISDPGFSLVRAARRSGVEVSPLPGACAAIAALSVSGLASDAFYFIGFLPPKSTARCQRLQQLSTVSTTLIFYESPRRVLPTLQDMVKIFGADRQAVVAREITKCYETIRSDSLLALINWLTEDEKQQRGEFVLLIAGNQQVTDEISLKYQQLLKSLLAELPLKQAVSLAAKISGGSKNRFYQLALSYQQCDKTNKQ